MDYRLYRCYMNPCAVICCTGGWGAKSVYLKKLSQKKKPILLTPLQCDINLMSLLFAHMRLQNIPHRFSYFPLVWVIFNRCSYSLVNEAIWGRNWVSWERDIGLLVVGVSREFQRELTDYERVWTTSRPLHDVVKTDFQVLVSKSDRFHKRRRVWMNLIQFPATTEWMFDFVLYVNEF